MSSSQRDPDDQQASASTSPFFIGQPTPPQPESREELEAGDVEENDPEQQEPASSKKSRPASRKTKKESAPANRTRIPIHQICTCGKKNAKTPCKCRWELRYRDLAGKSRESRFSTYDEAYTAYLKIQASKRDGTFINPVNSKRKFADVFVEWVNHGNNKLSEATYESYKINYKNHYGPMFGDRMIGSINSDDIAEWQQWQKDKGYKQYGIEVRLNVLSSIFNFAVRREIIGRNPCHAHVNSRAGNAYQPVRVESIPSDAEVLAIISELPPHHRLVGWLMAYGGARPREALVCSLESLDRESELWYVNRQLDRFQTDRVTMGDSTRSQRRGARTKETKHRADYESRYVPLAPGLIEQIDIHLRTFEPWGDEGWLFESPRYDFQFPSYAIFLKAFKAAAEQVAPGRDIQPKAFRHYFVSMCLGEGIPVYDVAQWVGHTNTSTTEKVYAHVMAKTVRKTRTAIGRRMMANIAELAAQATDDGKVQPPTMRGWGDVTLKSSRTKWHPVNREVEVIDRESGLEAVKPFEGDGNALWRDTLASPWSTPSKEEQAAVARFGAAQGWEPGPWMFLTMAALKQAMEDHGDAPSPVE